jgi:hypothetical protein
LFKKKEEFLANYPDQNILEKSLAAHINRIVDRFVATGSVEKGKSSGRPKVMEDVVENIQEHPLQDWLFRLVYLAVRHKIVKKNLHFLPYKVTTVQELLPNDPESRINYCNWFQNNLNNDRLLDLSFFSDEAWCHVSGYVNSQNVRYWSSENPHVFVEAPLHPMKVGVWIAVSRRRLIGPIFFHQTINAERYRELILNEFINQLDDEELQYGYF